MPTGFSAAPAFVGFPAFTLKTISIVAGAVGAGIWGRQAALPRGRKLPRLCRALVGRPQRGRLARRNRPRIHVGPFGCLPDGATFAVIRDPQKGCHSAETHTPGPKLQVRRRDRTVAFEGEPSPWQNGRVPEDSGDRGGGLRVRPLRESGESCETCVDDVQNNRRPPSFRTGADVYRDVLRAAVRT